MRNFGQPQEWIVLEFKKLGGVLPTLPNFAAGLTQWSPPSQPYRVDFKIEEDRGKIEEDWGKIEERSRKDRGKIEEDRGSCVFFSEPLFGAIFVTLEFLGTFGRMVCADGLRFGARFRLWSWTPPPPPCREIYQPTFLRSRNSCAFVLYDLLHTD